MSSSTTREGPQNLEQTTTKTQTLAFELDGAQVTANPGESIWDVARRLDTAIPHLCHRPEPGYRPDGNCRVCMVEIEGERTLAPSCKRQPAIGMKVHTNTGRATTARRLVMELLVADQPPRATSHDPASAFWQWADQTHVTESRFPPAERWTHDPATPPCASTSTPASSATSASAPAAKSRSTTSSAWLFEMPAPRSYSISTTPWAAAPA